MKAITSIAVLISLFLSACGGGGGGPTTAAPPPSTSSFSFLNAYTNLAASGWSKTFIATQAGTVICNGSGSISFTAPTLTTFPNTPTTTVPAYSSVESITQNWSNCLPASVVASATKYYSTSYMPLGYIKSGVSFGVFATASSIPTIVKVGDNGTVGTEMLYTDSTQATSTGSLSISYSVSADTASTAIITLLADTFDTSAKLVSTEQDAYRISASGVLTPVSMVLSTGGNTVYWTYN